jgi:very-short-patch-repair endonuclease
MGHECADAPERLHGMVQFNHQVQTLRDNGMAPLADRAATWPPAGAHLADLMEHTYHRALVERAFEERPALAKFDGANHAQAVESFRKRDKALFAYHRAELALAHWQGLPKKGAAGAVGLLKHEFEKKSHHLPIRKLIKESGRAMQRIKPVFMMSPMSVAKYLPPGSADFDLVVFDEASQVRPIEAFGSLLRADQAVVVGDTKQLPPTSFFDSMTEPEDPTEQRAGDLESILGLFNAKGAPERMLRFHYRSRHESLIAVSNQEFYDNKLVVFPSPDEGVGGLGVHYHHLPETRYDRGGSRTNRGEAKRVAETVMEHARTVPHRTLGVATFSTAQMKAVQHQLEILRREDPSCEPFFGKHEAEPFFVKNLENVQGDERDRILISVGYGKDQNGKLSMNFGPLNRTGGERRLNVLITRAKRRCEIFTNLRPEDIDLSRTDARGVEVLKRYLQFAATGELKMPILTGGGVDSPFEAQVARALREAGCEVAHQVGVAGFRIDLAAKDPDAPGRYLVGIECDGASYHSARTARERDRTRQAVLEGLGWRIHRIWSTDWFRRPEREVKSALAAVEEAKAAQGSTSGSPPGGNADAASGDEDEHTPTVTRGEPEVGELEDLSAPAYEKADLAVDLNGQALHEVRTERLARWLEAVAEVEGPVHFEDAARRVLKAAGVSRLGSRLRRHLEDAAEHSAQAGVLERWNDFLFLEDAADDSKGKNSNVPVRDRGALPAAERDFARIAPAEIAAAAEQVVRASMGLAPEEVPVRVARLLGFARTSEAIREQVRGVLSVMQRDGRLDREGAHLVVP